MPQHSSAALWSIGIITAATIGAATALLYSDRACRSLDESQRKKDPKPSYNHSPTAYSEELIREQLARNYAFLGEEGMTKVRGQRVVVVGAGGVGLAVATLLVRLGVGRLRVIDFDQVSLLSLNRHAVATVRDVGTSKVECLRSHLNAIAPWVSVDAVNCLWTIECAQRLLIDDFEPTYVVDCIDNIDTKVDLLHYCHQNKLPVISLGGAACKLDPTRINVADISLTEEDPLCRQVRIRLKKRGVTSGISMVFSAEKPDPRKAQLLPLSQDQLEEGEVGEFSALRDFRVRILPVLGTVPGMFGLSIATYLVSSVAGYPIDYVEGKNRYTSYESIYQSLAGQQLRIGETDQRVPILVADVAYIVQEVYRGKSVVSEFLLRLTLLRWDPAKELSFQNIVVLTKEEQKQHETRVLNGKEDLETVYLPQILEKVAARFEQERYYSLWK